MNLPTAVQGNHCAGARLLAPAAIWATALLVWPPLEHPFSTPKLAALAVAAVAACALAVVRPGAGERAGRPRAPRWRA